MPKDSKGHGSNAHAAHKASHGPSGIEHGPYGNGSDHHGMIKVSVKRPIEHKIESIGPGGKVYHTEKSKGWKD